jgi:hypothetical protein
MASYQEQERSSTHGSDEKVVGGRPTAQHILDERRRAALAEIDNAAFSYVVLFMITALVDTDVRLSPLLV